MQGLKIKPVEMPKWRSRTASGVRAAGDDDKKRGDRGNPGTAVITKTKTQTKRPNLYRVLILNDDYTPMEFVVMVLQEYFNRDLETATQIMLKIHHDGRGVCGVYSKDVAGTKVELVLAAARRGGHPLQCTMESA
jgi:ATP-dependent Clp protease adaptor protein ClpS